MRERNVVEEHYRRLGNEYDEFLLYSSEFVRALTEKMVARLDLREDDRLVDLGAGTGMYSLDILAQVPLRAPVVAVEPFEEMLRQMPEGRGLEPVLASAEEFAARPVEYDKVLMKEMIHHVEDRGGLFAALRDRLPAGGRMLLVHVPPRLDYPLFQRALERSERWHADPDDLVRELESVGLEVERDELDHAHSIPKEHYFRMVRGQYMSVLSSFSGEEIEVGLAEMAERWADCDVLEFSDHFDYIVATKP